MPTGLTSLISSQPMVYVFDLSNRVAGYAAASELQETIQMIPGNISHLILSGNVLSNFSGAELAEIFKKIPPNVTHLDLYNNFLGDMPPEELIKAIAAIPKTIVKLDLSWNKLHKLPYIELIRLLDAIPKTLLALNLQGNRLSFDAYNSYNGQRNHLFDAFPPNLTTLVLADNFLTGVGVRGKLHQTLRNIPRSVTSLNICRTELHMYSPEELALAFAELPPQLTTINLTPKFPDKTTDDQWAIALHKMPTTVACIAHEPTRSLVDFLPMTTKIRQYTLNVLAYLTALCPELIKLVMDYTIEQPTIWPECYTISPGPIVQMLDEQNQPETRLLPLPIIPSFIASRSTYSNVFFKQTPGSPMMLLDPALNAVALR